MKKIIILSLLCTALSFSSVESDEKYEKFSNSITSNSLYKSLLTKDMESELFITEKGKRDIINQGKDDDNLKLAIYIYYNEVLSKKFKGKNIDIPDYIKVLDLLRESANSGNQLSSYIGFSILQKYFLMNGNTIGREYLKEMVVPLAKEDNPVALMWYGRANTKELSKGKGQDYFKAKKAYKKSLDIINEMLTTPDFEENKDLKTFKVIVESNYSKVSSLIFLNTEREAGRYHRVKRNLRKPNYTLDLKKDKETK